MKADKLIALMTTAALALGAATMAEAGPFKTKKGKGGSEVQGAAGTETSTGNDDLARCDKPMGALAVVEPQDYVMQALSRYQLGSPSGLIRMMVQQSNCFIVVERGMAMNNMMQERSLADSGQLRESSNIGGGQMVAADFVLTPAVVFSDDNAGGVGGAIGGFIGRRSRILGGAAAGVQFKEAQTSMLVTDARSGVQVAAAEGSAKKADFNFGALLGGGGIGGAGGGYGSTDQGKILAASYADNFNQIVQVVRNDPNLQRNVGTLAEEAGTVTIAGAVFNEGDVIQPKIGNVKLMANPSDGASVVATLPRGSEMVYMGAAEGNYLQVETAEGGGWVKKALVKH
ncbi:MAG: SH3 domain-containing protein [Pseudomonadota bacterium]